MARDNRGHVSASRHADEKPVAGRAPADRAQAIRERFDATAQEARAPETDEEEALYERYRQTRLREQRGLSLTAAHKAILDAVEVANSPYRWMLAHWIVQSTHRQPRKADQP